MKKLSIIIAMIISMLLVLSLAVGCFGQNIVEKIAEEAIEKAIESESGENVEIDLDDGGISIQGDDGEVNISSDDDGVKIESDDGEATLGLSAELPDGFPDSAPVYPGMEITSSWTSLTDEQNSYFVTGLTDDAGDDVFAWYQDELNDWEIEGEFNMSTDEGETSSLTANGKGLIMNIIVIESNDEGTTITLTVTEE
ncbi:hypothetical protein ACFLQQ_02925 [Actinomycetota bacterium]